MRTSARIAVVCFTLFAGAVSWRAASATTVSDTTASGGAGTTLPKAASTPSDAAAPPGGTNGSAGPATGGTPQSDVTQSVTVLSATQDAVDLPVVLHGLEENPNLTLLTSGPLVSTTAANIQIQPKVTVTSQGEPKTTTVRVTNLVAFGESTIPLLYKGRQIELLRFSKPGLVTKPASESGFVAREGSKWPIVLENPAGFNYTNVKARLRFSDTDGCAFDAEAFEGVSPKPGTMKEKCNTFANWAQFNVPQYAQVTLWAQSPGEWFVDPGSGYARAGKRKGLLTLRFQENETGPIHEQTIPLEVQFEPATGTLAYSLAKVGAFLSLGALLSLVLRVWLPNGKRNRQLRDQLDQLAKQTASISSEVDSNLRVLLRVERIALNEVRLSSYAIWPGFVDFAQRVEQGLPILKKRIEAVKRLDAALTRKRLVIEQGVAPTRLLQIETQLDSVSETLKQELLSDEEWVFVNQRLEAALKTLREPTQAENEAFDAMLVSTWKIISKHFGFDPATHTLKVPETLKGTMDSCFPADPSLLPGETEDGSDWIQSFGTVRADLQLSALKLLMEFQFLAPSVIKGTAWEDKAKQLNALLATPAIDNLREARSLLRQFAERVSEADIVKALTDGKASIIIDPPIPRPNQKIRFTVCFLDERLNSAAAADRVQCHWTFRDRRSGATFGRTRWRAANAAADKSNTALVRELDETGWYVHHYFEGDVLENVTTLKFYDSRGELLMLGEPPADSHNWPSLSKEVTQASRGREQFSRGRLEFFQLAAALLVPLATMASNTINSGGSEQWWGLVAIGFGADTIKSILTGQQAPPTSTSTTT